MFFKELDCQHLEYKMDENLHTISLKIQKAHSSMLYFILESNENIAFYSTLESAAEQEFRIVEINCHLSLKKQLDGILAHFATKYPVEYL